MPQKPSVRKKKLLLSKRQEPQEVSLKSPNKYFSIEKTVFLEDTNMMGNTYFANYVAWQGEARETLLLSHPNIAAEMKASQHIRMITHSVYHRFMEETTFGDRVEIRVTCKELKRCSFVLMFRYYNKKTNSFIGEGWQRITFLDQTRKTLCKIPNFVRELVAPIEEDSSIPDSLLCDIAAKSSKTVT